MELDSNIFGLKNKLSSLFGKSADNTTISGKMAGSLAPITKVLRKTAGKYCFNNEKLLGLEISPHYIRICQMKNSYEKWSLNQLASTCMETQFTNLDISQHANTYVDNLKILLEKHKIKTKDVALSIPTSQCIIKIINMPDMAEEDLASAAQMGGIWESMVQLNGSIYEYSVYYKLLRRGVKPSLSLASAEIPLVQEINPLENLLGTPEIITTTAHSDGIDLNNLLGEVAPVAAQAAPENNLNLENILSSGTDIPLPEIADANIIAPENHLSVEITPMVSVESLSETITEPMPETAVLAEEANTMDVLFVAAKKTDIALYTSIAQSAGLNPVIVDAKAGALKHAFDTNPNKRDITYPYALIEFGADENYAYIVEETGIALYSITISEEDRQFMARSEENSGALAGFVQRYAAQLQNILRAYESQKKSKIYNIYVSSNSPLHVEDASSEPLIHNFIENLTQIMGTLKIQSCNFCNHIDVPAEFAKKVNAEGNLSSWATVLGLATYRLDIFDYNEDSDPINRVNLLPGYEDIKHVRTTSILSAGGAAIGAMMVIIILAICDITLRANGSSIIAQISGLSTVKNDFEGKNKELQKLSIVMDNVKSLDSVRNNLPSNQLQILTAYKDITKVIPEGVWLSNISYISPHSIEIQGNSITDQSILEFVNKLNESGGFKRIALKTMIVQENKENDKSGTESQGSANVKKFTLVGDLKQDPKAEKLELLKSGAK